MERVFEPTGAGKVIVEADLASLHRALAQGIAVEANLAIRKRGVFRIALAGGQTPRAAYELLAQNAVEPSIDWSRVEVYFSDERFVPSNDPGSNERMARESLLNHVEVPENQIFPMYRPGTVEEAAEAYDALIRSKFGESEVPQFDMVLLGVGTDGHTASLFPNSPALAVTDKWAAYGQGPEPYQERVTLTFPVLENALSTVMVVAGRDKSEILSQILHPQENSTILPATRVLWSANNSFLLTDQVTLNALSNK